ncbi:TRAP transporter small permease [Parasphingorhabdus halotolerans]|uniref:TRAP transporter small permease protein n=1 Tax=Parasphingorhabdus halotolerans TaxID=2725558 RepID=A0A6H2DNM3_9SPHN|nr:TRAP transporter small permease [Parasphingorhabdus halotolerans]QJB70259.1 TRAP transporter small permease [Parasphingorhabdus halotolerans]
MLEKVTAFNSRLCHLILWLSAAGLVAMTFIIGWQVFARYVLNDSPSWSEQASLILMIWYAVIAAAAGFHEGFHIRILAVQTSVSEPVARAMRLLAEAVVIICGVMMLIWGIELTGIISSHVIPSLGISRSWAYLPLPISGALIILFAGTRFAGEIIRPGWTAEKPVESQMNQAGTN